MTAESATALPVEFLDRLELQLGSRAAIEDGPQGTRIIRNILSGRFDGPRLKGRLEVCTSNFWSISGSRRRGALCWRMP
jgi:hypothetical protein